MGDEYTAKLILDELTETCPGDLACHGCLHWCPVCGDVANVCDDPRCDSHPRVEDQLRKIEKLKGELAKLAADAKRWEERLLQETDLSSGSRMAGIRVEIRRVYEWARATEPDLDEEEEKLKAVRTAGVKLVPRPKPRRENPGQARLPFG